MFTCIINDQNGSGAYQHLLFFVDYSGAMKQLVPKPTTSIPNLTNSNTMIITASRVYNYQLKIIKNVLCTLIFHRFKLVMNKFRSFVLTKT